MNYTDVEKAGYFIVVVDAQLRYKSPAFYEDRLCIETTLEKFRGKVLEFSYRVLNQDERLLAGGRTRITSYNVCYTKLLRYLRFGGAQRRREVFLHQLQAARETGEQRLQR